jgi:DHA2 family multidrug resistance protein
MYNQAIEPNSPAYKSYVMQSTNSNMHNLGSSRIDAMKQGQYTLIANVSKQAYIEGIDDDFLIATIITLTGIVPILLLRSKKKKIQKVLTS